MSYAASYLANYITEQEANDFIEAFKLGLPARVETATLLNNILYSETLTEHEENVDAFIAYISTSADDNVRKFIYLVISNDYTGALELVDDVAASVESSYADALADFAIFFGDPDNRSNTDGDMIEGFASIVLA